MGRASTSIVGLLLVGALAVPASADAAQRRRDGSDQNDRQRASQGEERAGRQRERAVPRARVDDRQTQQQREMQAQQQRESEVQRQRQFEARRQREAEVRRQAEINRQRDQRRDNERWRDNDGRRDNDRWRNSGRPSYAYRGPRTVIVPRVVRPRIVTVVPYRPYVYRPRLGLGVYYGSNGYPYGYTPRGYYDPIPGRLYGGLRITDAPHEAQVFADGYYVGIVDDFDGVFQHLNLEVGPHRIEVRLPGYDDSAVVFDVVIQPGRTITYRADWY
jgi:hypothetical protein